MKSFVPYLLILSALLILSCGESKPERSHRVVTKAEMQHASSMKYIGDMNDFAEAENPENAVLFVGSSSVQMWTTLSQDLAPIPVINHGFGGSRFKDVIFWISNLVWDIEPDIVAVYEGDNDVASDRDTPEEVLTNFITFVELTRSKLSNTLIYFISIKPSPSREYAWEDMSSANTLIEAYVADDDKLFYLDVAAPMFDTNGVLMTDIFQSDDLHMNDAGYAIWTDVVKPEMEKVYGETE